MKITRRQLRRIIKEASSQVNEVYSEETPAWRRELENLGYELVTRADGYYYVKGEVATQDGIELKIVTYPEPAEKRS